MATTDRRAPADPELLAKGLLHGDRAALSRAITLVESRRPEHSLAAGKLLSEIMPATGKATRLGITGVPGVGKSTFIDSFGIMLTGMGHKVAVLAVDPTSGRTRGSILGDKTRMARLSTDPSSFIRPSPAGEELGGVAAMTRESMLLCEAAGYDIVIVETVGVGQSENAVAEMVDFFLVLMLPGAGDELQGIKKGLVEFADMIVVNKADDNNQRIAQQAAQHYRRALHIIEPRWPDWMPPVALASALQETGLENVWKTIAKRIAAMRESSDLETLRTHQAKIWMRSDFIRRVLLWLDERDDLKARKEELQALVTAGKLPATRAAESLAKLALGGR